MPETKDLPVKDLKVDLVNFRTVPQANEPSAIRALVEMNPDWFWALAESLLDDGYLPTENILILKAGPKGSDLLVREGNRRVSALKLIHGLEPLDGLDIPTDIRKRINQVPAEWKAANQVVPCAIFEPNEESKVDRIVTLAHGKADKAGRDKWNAVATARHNRDKNNGSEPGLDLLEKYLSTSKNLTEKQSRWAAVYPLSVLDEAIKRIASRLGATNAPDLAKKYPNVLHRDALELILQDIGLGLLGFKEIRDDKEDFGIRFGLPPKTSVGSTEQSGGTGNEANGSRAQGAAADTGHGGTSGSSREAQSGPTVGQKNGESRKDQSNETAEPKNTTASETAGGGAEKKSRSKAATTGTSDPKSVTRALKKLVPKGQERIKVLDLRNEAISINLEKTPIAFCFILRSMFEISAKIYIEERKADGLSTKKKDNQEKSLKEMIADIVNHMAAATTDQEQKKKLYGANTELSKKHGILSVPTMNQLVHNPHFSVIPSDISIVFHQVFPLLQEMNP